MRFVVITRDAAKPNVPQVPSGETGFLGGSKHERIEAHVDAWVCASCGFAELYARDLEQLAFLAENGDRVVVIDATPGSEGTFR